MASLFPAVVLLLVPSIIYTTAQVVETRDDCIEATRPHSSRCDQYFRCTVLADESHAWVAAQCQKGLVYMQNLGTCVVPDSDWECDLSSENEHDHSEENVYGIENLNGVFTNTMRTTPTPDRSKERSQELVQANDLSLEFNELESSGDGSTEQLNVEPTVVRKPISVGKKPSNFVTKPPTSNPSGILSQQQLDSFLAFYDTQSGVKSKSKPPPLSEKNHLEHLKEIIKQQNQLNRMGNQFKDTTFSWPKPAVLSGERKPASEKEGEKDDSTVKIPPGMEDIIRSILQISQQAIANQKSATVAHPAEPVVKPIFIPISVNPVQPAAAGSSVNPPSSVLDQVKPTSAMMNDRTPGVGSGVEGPFQMDRNAMGNVVPVKQTFNDSFAYNQPQQILYDAYGNRYVAKDSYQMMPPYGPGYGYNPFSGVPSAVSGPGANYGTKNWSPFDASTPVQQSPNANEQMFYKQNPMRPIFPQEQQPSGSYDKLRDIIERIDQLSAIESNEKFDNEERDSEDDKSDGDWNDAEKSSEEEGPPGMKSSKLRRKLFTLGDTTFDYDQYKDSMLPLVEANPDDDRISVVTCMVGSRQPNKTDCFRYYICNPHNGVFQSYTCPSLTAFNKHSRMCDMASYKPCKAKINPPATERPLMKRKKGSVSASDIGQLKSELRTAQRYVEMIREEAEKLRLHSSLQTPAQKIIFLPSMDFTKAGGEPGQRKPAPGKRKPVKKITTTAAPATKKPSRPTVPRCRLEGRMPDPADNTNYFVCHRKSPKKFIKIKMACPGSLIYCAASQYCTVKTNC